MQDLTNLYPHAIRAAEAAGGEIMSIYQRDFAVEDKADNSPLTEADLAAHNRIVAELQKLTPQMPILSEEHADIPWAERQQWHEYWLVDPLDGTKEFIKKNGEFTVNIAHIKGGEPVWGVVVAPALGVTYYGGTAVGGSIKVSEGEAQTLAVATPPSGKSGWRIVGSRSHQSDEFKAFVADFDEPVIKSMGSSLKICLVAEGAADLYPRLGPTSEWDTGAAHAVLSAAGGRIKQWNSDAELAYNKRNILNPLFLAVGASE